LVLANKSGACSLNTSPRLLSIRYVPNNLGLIGPARVRYDDLAKPFGAGGLDGLKAVEQRPADIPQAPRSNGASVTRLPPWRDSVAGPASLSAVSDPIRSSARCSAPKTWEPGIWKPETSHDPRGARTSAFQVFRFSVSPGIPGRTRVPGAPRTRERRLVREGRVFGWRPRECSQESLRQERCKRIDGGMPLADGC
jgi:hypothetical protein